METAVNGAYGVEAVRSTSDIGLSLIYVEFGWEMDIYTARQIVQERITTISDRLPEDIQPQMGPISSLLGQIMILGMYSDDGTTGPLEMRTLADWVVRQQLLAIPGTAQVITMGGGRKQFQVLVNPHALHKFDVTLHDIEEALSKSNLNVTGGYINKGAKELLVRGLGRVHSLDDLKQIVIKHSDDRSIVLDQVATVVEAAQVKRGDSLVNGKTAVVLTIQKQPGADTRQLTEAIRTALDDIRQTLPKDVVLEPTYEQRAFIDFSVHNVVEALRDGAILVVIVLFIFLINFRTTFITLTAIPLSVLTTALVFRWYDMSINVMTLGGIAVAIGELVDDAIVDVENIFHRLKQNSQATKKLPIIQVVFRASQEVRSSIFISTVLVILVFSPLFALSGMEGRLFRPLGVAYIVSILASTVVSLTVTPVLSYYLLGRAKITSSNEDSPPLVLLKMIASPFIRFSMTGSGMTFLLTGTIVCVALSVWTVMQMGKDFLPPFDEGAAQLNVYLPPGSSLETTKRICAQVDGQLQGLIKNEDFPDAPLLNFTCRIGRAEEDEHAMNVNVAEYVITLNPETESNRAEVIELLHQSVEHIPGIQKEVEQPIAHLISHMLSGVTAQIAVKLFGDDLDVLRQKAEEIKSAIADVPGLAEPVVEQQQLVPQLRIEVDRERLAFYGISSQDVNEFVETALNGKVVSTLLEEQRYFDVLLRLDEPYRKDLANLHRMPIELPHGTLIPLSAVARVYEGAGPNTIKRENTRRRIVVRVNTLGSDLGSAVAGIRDRIRRKVDLPAGYFVHYGGQFEAQQSATKRILWLSALAIVGVFFVLYSVFPSLSVVLQILVALPAAFVGGVAALLLTDQSLSVASMVGFISLGGIAARNGILLVSHYVHLHAEEGFTKEMILRGNLERLAPVLMTALTTGIGLVPLVIEGDLPGKEILFPVATVILGGLISSTFAEFLLRPGMYWFFSRSASTRLATAENSVELLDAG